MSKDSAPSDARRDQSQRAGVDDVGEETYCYRHQDTPTRLRCSRCGRPICGRCATPASVGQHCPECVTEARRGAPRVRSVVRATAPAVYFILVLNVVVYILQLLVPAITDLGAQFPPAIAQGAFYRLITAMFLHDPNGLWHILFNSFALYVLGPQTEDAIGTVRFVALYLITGFTASALSYTFIQCNTPSLGASGAVFGVIGFLLVYAYNRRRLALMDDFMRRIIVIILINLAIGFFSGLAIDNYAHLGGLAGGVLLGLGFDQGGRGVGASRLVQLGTALGVVALAVALVAYRTATFSCIPFRDF